MASTKPFVLVAAFMLAITSVFGQNYIGMHKDEIRKKVASDLTGFVFVKEISNGNKSFIKFENTFEEQTLIFMLNTEGYCTSVSRMYNTWLYNRLTKQLNADYEKINKQLWVDNKGVDVYEIELIKGKWFLTVVTRKKKE